MKLHHIWKRFVKKNSLEAFAINVSATGKQLYNRWIKGSPVEAFTSKASTTGKQLYNSRVKGSPVETFAIRTTTSTKNFIKRYYINWRTKKIADKILNIRVKNPYAPSFPCTLGDLCIMSYYTESNILEIARRNGIELPSKAEDFSGNNILEYLYYHGKEYQFMLCVEDGHKVPAGLTNIGSTTWATPVAPPITRDHLEHMISLFHGNNETWNSIYGQAAEFSVRDQLQKEGYKILMPSARKHEATALLVDKKFFIDKDIKYTESTDHPGFGFLQIKTTSSILPPDNYTANTLHHLEINPDIPVICSTKIANTLGDYYPSQIIGFSNIGINDTQLESILYHQFMQLKSINPEVLDCLNGVAYGLDESVFSDTLNSASTSTLPHTLNDSGVVENSLDIGFHNIPLIGTALIGTLAFKYNIEKVQQYEITLEEAYANTANVMAREKVNTASTVAKEKVINTASTVGTKVVLGAMGTSLSGQMNGLADAISDNNIGNIASSAAGIFGTIVLAAGIEIISSVIYDKFFDKTKDLKRKIRRRDRSAANIAIFITTKMNKDDIISQFSHPVYKLKNDIEKTKLKISQLKSENDIYPISYYVAKRKLDFFVPICNMLNRQYNKIINMFNYLSAASSFLSLPQDTSRECKEKWKKIIKSSYIKHNDNKDIEEAIDKVIDSDEKFSETIRMLIEFDIDNFLPYIEKIKNDELNNLITIFEQNKIIVQNEENKLRKEGVAI